MVVYGGKNMDLFERIALLQRTGQISENVREHLERVLIELRDQWGVPLENEGIVKCVTHLALACTRAAKQEPVAPLDPALLAEVRDSAFLSGSEVILEHLEAVLGLHFPDEEKGYLLLHLCSILEELEGKQ